MLAQKFELVNSGLTVNSKYIDEYGVILVENTQRQSTFGVEIKLTDAITFAKAILAMTEEANGRLPTDAEMALMDADYRGNMDIGADLPF